MAALLFVLSLLGVVWLLQQGRASRAAWLGAALVYGGVVVEIGTAHV